MALTALWMFSFLDSITHLRDTIEWKSQFPLRFLLSPKTVELPHEKEKPNPCLSFVLDQTRKWT